ncbi:hypothetical protein HYN69_06755 [Gemmobacter aquarius]|uniref:7TM-DISM receptor extracellular domain-containing protein n=1 Tax=Paragemmobacter aquarius TaxID=2169400 RepID=A0A2S0UK98_9RHOB|nr:7TM-DISM domain-containing protein [Gemmobacter aquarius]AWB48247.1 hypothetical protein HYN69_06755 [Gemmobacter aquarius]
MTGRDHLRKAARIVAVGAGLLLLLAYVAALYRTDAPAELIESVEHYTDPSARLTVSEIRDKPFTPSQSTLGGVSDGAAYWYRLRLGKSHQDLLLDLGQGSVDQAWLYLPGGPRGSWQMQQSGDTLPFGLHQSRRVPVSFVVPRALAGQDIYLRVVSKTGVFRLGAEPVSLADQRLNRQIALHMVYFALLAMGVLLALLRLWRSRSELSLALAAFLITYFIYSMESLGYGLLLFDGPDPAFHDRVQTGTSFLMVFLSMLFQRYFLRQHRPNRMALKAADLVICAQAMLALPLAAGDTGLAGSGMNVTAAVFLGLLLVLLGTAQIESRPLRNVLWAVYAVHLPIAAFRIASRIGIDGALSASSHFVEVYGLASLFLALTLLVIDTLQQQSRARDAVLSLAAAQSAQSAHDKNSRTQDGFMHMLVHEVRNHLSVLQVGLSAMPEAGDRTRLADAVRDLDHALTRAQHLVWLDQDRWPLHPRPNALLETLDHVIDDLGIADRLHLQGDSPDAEVYADPALLEALLGNVLLAAVQALGTGRVITLELTQTPQTGMAQTGVAQTGACRIDLHVPLQQDAAPRGWQGPEAAIALRLSDAMQAGLDVTTAAGSLCITLTLPP